MCTRRLRAYPLQPAEGDGWGGAGKRGKNRTPSPPVASAIATSPTRNYLVPVVYRWSIDRPSDIALPPSSRVSLPRGRRHSIFLSLFRPGSRYVSYLFSLPEFISLSLSLVPRRCTRRRGFSRPTRKSRFGLSMQQRRAVLLAKFDRGGFDFVVGGERTEFEDRDDSTDR